MLAIGSIINYVLSMVWMLRSIRIVLLDSIVVNYGWLELWRLLRWSVIGGRSVPLS